MHDIDQLKDAHRRLRLKLNILESALDMGAETRFVIREVCFSMSKQLHKHMASEARWMAACHRALGQCHTQELGRLAIDHDEEQQCFLLATRLLSGDSRFPLDAVRCTLTTALAALRRQMAEQEAQLFPLLELALDLQGVFGPYEVLASSRLTESMTVQEVLSQYPQTKAIFEQFHVNDLFELYETLAEVSQCHEVEAWKLPTCL